MLTVACLAKNEANKFWQSALEAWGQFADAIVVLDDHSDDGTAEMAEEAGAIVYRRGAGVSAWGVEAPARAELWEHALAETPDNGFIFVLDADMVPAKSPKPFLTYHPNAIAFRLYDMWNAGQYRADGYWKGHIHSRIWLVKKPREVPPEGWLWPERGIHTGHFPLNLQIEQPMFYAPLDFSLLHYAYSTHALRWLKAQAYESVAAQLTPQEQMHVASINQVNPTLVSLAFKPDFTLTLEPSDAGSPEES